MDYVKIPLTKGYEAIIDAADFDLVGHLKWQTLENLRHNKVYATRKFWFEGKLNPITMHRFLTKAPKGMVVDHINGDGLDNRRSNLRICTNGENARNSRRVSSKSGYKGVWETKPAKTGKLSFLAQISCFGRRWLGTYKSVEEAAVAYDLAAKELHGEYAATNRDLGLLAHMSDWQYEQLGKWLLENTKLRHYIAIAKTHRDGRVDLGYKGMTIETKESEYSRFKPSLI